MVLLRGVPTFGVFHGRQRVSFEDMVAGASVTQHRIEDKVGWCGGYGTGTEETRSRLGHRIPSYRGQQGEQGAS